VRKARWQLGVAETAQTLPTVRTREINLPPDIRLAAAPGAPWRYLIDATAPGGVEVDGMGLDSEWSADLQLRGTTEAPRIGGVARVVPRQGFYSFAGVRFDITRGTIFFQSESPPDPRIDIRAETVSEGLAVAVTVTGNSSKPEIAFSSVPALPEEELLARMLFGDGVSNLSATDALQLGAAVASLRGGGGMDPINRLRTAIGLQPKNAQAHLALANLLNASPNGKAEADAEYAEVRALDPHLLPAPPPTAVVPAAPAPGAAPPAEAAVTPPSAPGGTHKLKPINRKFKLTHDSAVYQAADSSTSVVGQVHHGHFVHVTGIQGSWLQITLRNGTVGFIPVAAAE